MGRRHGSKARREQDKKPEEYRINYMVCRLMAKYGLEDPLDALNVIEIMNNNPNIGERVAIAEYKLAQAGQTAFGTVLEGIVEGIDPDEHYHAPTAEETNEPPHATSGLRAVDPEVENAKEEIKFFLNRFSGDTEGWGKRTA
jgi:hypothetical protein